MNRHIAIAALSLALTASLAAPAFAFEDYLAHRDTLTAGAGDANATNLATQTIDPWPPYVGNTKIRVDGKRLELGTTRYEQNKSIEPRGLSPSGTSFGRGSPGLTK